MEADTLKISFVIPAYNEANYLARCLSAILREIGGRKDIEVIVVNNNSDDNTDEVVGRFPGVTLIHEARRGANRARQTGFEASHGELVAFLDADTDMPPGWIARAEGAFEKYPGLVCISGPFIYYDLPAWTRMLVRLFYYLAYVYQSMINILIQRTTVIQGGNYMLRRRALEAIGGHNVGLIFYGDDTDLAVRLSKVGRVKFTFRLPMRTSGRRLAKEGVFTMGLRYSINNLWIVLFGRPFTKVSTEIRLENHERIYAPENRLKELVIALCVLAVFCVILGGAGYLIYRAMR